MATSKSPNTMKPNIQNSDDLLSSITGEEEYARLITQLIRDFERTNLVIDLPAGLSPEQLRILLREKVYFLIMEAFDDYLTLMYIIDIPEKSFRELKVTDVVEIADQVVFLILRREIQKVRFKSGSVG